MPRVLVLTSTFPRRAGDTVPSFVLSLCQAVQQRGWTCEVLAPHAAGLQVTDDMDGVRCRRFRYAPESLEQLAYGGGMLANVRGARWRLLLLPVFLLSQFFHAAAMLPRGQSPLVHAHWIIPQGVVAALLKRLLWWRRIRLVITAHGSDVNEDMGGVARRVSTWALRQADVVTAVSGPMCRRLVAMGVDPARVRPGPMGVDGARFSPPDAAATRAGVVFVGRLVASKGVEHLLHAFSQLGDAALRLRIVGDGPLRPDLEALVHRLGIDRQVEFLGAQPAANVPRYFREAALCVVPSLAEGLGLVVAEAMACGCPVVASDLPAIRDLLTPDVTGRLAPAGDPVALADAMRRALGEPDVSRRLAAHAILHVREGYGWAGVALNYENVYRTALAADQA